MNIISIEKHVFQETIDKNAENLRMAQLNLSDFNKRMGKTMTLFVGLQTKILAFF